jgi:outer membrane receptor protein involved in Fe transport
LTQGFTGPGNTITASYFRTLSELKEVGAKFELLEGRAFAFFSAFQQTRHVSSTISASSPNYFPVKLKFDGFEAAFTYQPSKQIQLGLNYAYLHAILDNQVQSALSSNYLGTVADGVTIFTNSTGSNDPSANTRGNWRANGAPLHTVNGYGSYYLGKGFGVRLNGWVSSSWSVNKDVSVGTQFQLGGGVFWGDKKWNVSLDVNNLTDERNWSRGAGIGGDTSNYLLQREPFGLSGKIAYKF